MHHIEAIHLAENPQRCCICRKKFAQAGNVKRHIRFVHLRERPFQCNDCDSTFDRYVSYFVDHVICISKNLFLSSSLICLFSCDVLCW